MKSLIKTVCTVGWWIDIVGLLGCGSYLAFKALAPLASYSPSYNLGNFFPLAILMFLASVFFLEYVGKKMTVGKSSYFFSAALRGFSKAWIVWLPLFIALGAFFYLKVDISTPSDGGLVMSNGVYEIVAHAKTIRTLSPEEGQRILSASYNFDVLIAWVIQAVLFFYWDGLRRVAARGELIESDVEGSE